MNKKNGKIFILSIVLVVLALAVEFLFSNYQILFLNNDSKGIINTSYIEDGDKIKINNIDNFVKKLKISYKVEEDAPLTINYNYYNEFKKENSGVVNISLLRGLDEYVLTINKDIKSIEISDIETDDITNISIINDYTYSYVRAVGFSVLFLLIYYVIYNKRNIVSKLHILSFMIILSMGGLIIASEPTLGNIAPDDQIHMQNSYRNSSLSTVSYTNAFYYVTELPPHSFPLSAETNKELNHYLDSKEMTEGENGVKSKFIPYSDVPYLVAGVGIRLGDIMNLPFTATFCLGKLANLLFYDLMCFFAIKKAKIGRKIVFGISIIPSSIFLASNYSLDGIMISTLLLSTVTFMNMYYDREKLITKKELAIFLFPIILATFAKAIYGVLVLLLLLLPKEKFENNKQKNLFKLSIIGVFILLSYTYIAPMMTGSMGGDVRGGNTSFSGQLSSILSHPIGFVQMCISNIYNGIYSNLISPSMYVFFAYLGSPDFTIQMILFITLLYIFLTNGREFIKIKGKERIIISILILIICAMIYGAMYLTFTEVGNSKVEGVQSRYFLPLLLPIFIVLLPRIKFISVAEDKEYSFISIVLIFVIFLSVYNMMILPFAI
ncbi:DUF2142 domain-containing protein [Thomasclavelia saccharogumia]|uniref:DUF2142 domain-containing protein n=1 Tax=Thomasclavelia saccharogumia TaxID=341225 RepID=UPI00047E767E|nr:DUF2142 domain-containing protein [Thomasclavelia saccharogumia]